MANHKIKINLHPDKVSPQPKFPDPLGKNLVNSTDTPTTAPVKRTGKQKILKFFVYTVIFFITTSVVLFSQAAVSEQQHDFWFGRLPIIKQIRHLAESADRKLKGEDRDRINILLLGMGGKNHEGGWLTDTIILASLQPSTKKAALISIPRDLAVPIENKGWQKINSINAYAELEERGSGGEAVSQALGDILNIPIDYYVRVDFAGFVNIINELGGIDVYVDNTLDDYRYPIAGREDAEDYESRFQHLHIDKGWQHMDGELALKYARSRHALGVEGSDFARARRQQKIIAAVKEKLLSRHTLLKPTTINNIINQLQNHIATNLKIWEIIKLWQMFKDINKDNIINKVIDSSPNGLLVDSISPEGAYILTPRSGDFDEIQYFVNNIFSEAPVDEKTQVAQERATVEVRNGTWINGLASKVALDLEKYGFIVIRVGNSSRQNFEKSVIYDLTFGEKEKSLTVLRRKTDANVSYSLPQWLVNDIAKEVKTEKNPIKPDFILIVGQNTAAGEK